MAEVETATSQKDRDMYRCLHCGRKFWRGAGERRRADAKFCSDQHRHRYHNDKRPKKK